jgi:nitroreductase
MMTARKLIRRVLPRSARTRIRSFLDGDTEGSGTRPVTLARFLRIGIAALREARAVYRGQQMYLAQHALRPDHHFALRRNIHRLEKGLISRPRRELFALDYIVYTVDLFTAEARARRPGTNEDHLRWARDVLDQYFDIAPSHPTVEQARARFGTVRALIPESTNGRFAPFRRGAMPGELPTIQQLLALARRRRSVRWFESRAVPRELVQQALEVAVLSPSACNRQSFEFLIFDDAAMVRRVAELAAGTRGFNDNFPAIAVVVGRLRAYFHEKDRHVIYIDGALASMSFVLALETLGLSSCCINWPDVSARDEKMKQLLHLADDERIIMLIAFGFGDPEGMVPYSGKRSLDCISSFNRIPE